VKLLQKQLVAFFEAHAPEEVASADQLATRFIDNVDDLNAMLMENFSADLNGEGGAGDEPDGPPPVEDEPPPEALAAISAKLKRFYGKFNPTKLETIPVIANAYWDKEEELNAALMDAYKFDLNSDFPDDPVSAAATPPTAPGSPMSVPGGPPGRDGSTPMSLEEKLTPFYILFAKEKVGGVKVLAAQFAGKEGELNNLLKAQYKVDMTDIGLKEKLTAFYMTHAADQLSSVDMYAQRFAGNERQLNDLLMAEYEADLTCILGQPSQNGAAGSGTDQGQDEAAEVHTAEGELAIPDGYLSEDARVNRTLDRYRTSRMTNKYDMNSIQISVRWEGNTKSLKVPNPRIHREQLCVLWEWQIKDALGVNGTIADMWLRPTALVHKPSQHSSRQQRGGQALRFEASARHGNFPVVYTAYLQSGGLYEVQMEDRRDEALSVLTPKQVQEMKAHFESYDSDQSGDISKAEIEEHVRARTATNRAKIEAQFQAYLESNPNQVAEAEQLKAGHLAKLQEAEDKLLDQFQRADIDGNGLLSWREYCLAEAWWQSSNINPSKVALF
jgi:Ca2+-binding EF-hand superfamily protein